MGKKTDLILIRKVRTGDEKGIVEMMREGFRRKNFQYTGSNEMTDDKAKKIKKEIKLVRNPTSYCFVAIEKRKNLLVGSVSFHFRRKGRLRHRIDMGWGVHPDYQGRGIGTRLLKRALEFAKEKGFKRADAEAAIENKSSWKMAKKCGFKIEGIKRKALLTDDGRYIDNYVLGKVL